MNEEQAPTWGTVLQIIVRVDEQGPVDGTRWGLRSMHAMRDGVCVTVPASAFWPWAYGLVGVTVTNLPPDDHVMPHLIDFGLSDRIGPTAFGLCVDATWEDGRSRHAELSLDGFWADLVRLSETGEG